MTYNKAMPEKKGKGGKREGAGRKLGKPYPYRYSVRVDQAQHEFLEQVAADNDISVADVLRMFIDRARPIAPE